ncbi:unnamed protein product [Tilletia controversa]|nr:unnamed protein product [Tilletia controversa]
MAQAITQAAAASPQPVASSASSSTSSEGSTASGRLSPSDRRQRDAQRLSRLLEARSPVNNTALLPPASSAASVSAATDTSRSRTLRVPRTMLADASSDTAPIPAHPQSERYQEREPVPVRAREPSTSTSLLLRPQRSPVARVRPSPSALPQPSPSASPRPSPSAPAPAPQPARQVRRLAPSTGLMSIHTSSPPAPIPAPAPAPVSVAEDDAAMSDLEAEYDVYQQRLTDAKRRFTKWYSATADKVQERRDRRPAVHWTPDTGGEKGKGIEGDEAESESESEEQKEQDEDAEQEEEKEEEEQEQDEEDGEEATEKERDQELDQEKTETDQKEDSTHSTNLSTESVISDDIKPTQSDPDQPSTSPPHPWRSSPFLPPKPVLGTTLTISLLWTCGYILTLLQWQMRNHSKQHSGSGGSGLSAFSYSDEERQWMGEYYDPMYPELFEHPPSAEAAAATMGSGAIGEPGMGRALADALRFLAQSVR